MDVTASPVAGAVNEFRLDTELSFDLNQDAGSTVLLFRQRGSKEQIEFMHFCSTQWATYLLSLKSLSETGKDTPYPDDVDIGESEARPVRLAAGPVTNAYGT
jgi:hypothetical protein